MADMTVTTFAESEEGDTLLLWILAWSELVAFGILIGAFLIASVIDPLAFSTAQMHLRPGLAAINTLVLLTSGWQAALAARPGASLAETRRGLLLAALFGLVFLAVKLFEYSGEIGVAGDESFGVFFELYFLVTGFHLLHVVFGSAVLALVAWRPTRSNVALITTLWHVIDLVWIVLFPLFYLV
ncbi:cytochrome c oxidase subunit 3 [Ciceribacter azotifigens]|uniref:cytochrome c oxidase subunit 3 n=1 Tax=Ciceribacter azotifigens TaxID=2069303 RepID=UPI003A889CB3